jgi:hypothetical protein
MDNLVPTIVIGVLVGILTGVGLLIIEYRTGWFVKSLSSSRNKPLLTLRKRIANALRLTPRLTISVRDINCHVVKANVTRGTYRGEVWMWEFVCLVEIKNKGKAAVSNISSGAIELNLKGKDSVLALKIAPGTIRRLDLEKGQSIIRRIVFPREDVVKEHTEFYPNG